MDNKKILKENLITAVIAALAGAVVCRIIWVLYCVGMLYTMGIFYIAVIAGFYCVAKKTLFSHEVFFSVWFRGILAFLFTGFQVMGMYDSVPDMSHHVSILELWVWTLCLMPLTFAGQNALFIWFRKWLARREENSSNETLPQTRVAWNNRLARKHFIIAFFVIMAGYMIPFATYYPAIMAYDVIPQLDMIKISGYTTHHPLIHTLMLSLCLKIGEWIPGILNTDRAGLAIYSLSQMIIMAGGFAYVYMFFCKRDVNKYLRLIFLLAAAFYPTHGMLAVSITKDSIYAVLVMLFTTFTVDLVSDQKENPPKSRTGYFIAYTIITALLLLFRNNSIYAWVPFVIAALLLLRKEKYFKKLMISQAAAFALYLTVNTSLVILSGATNTTYAREMLSVPTQQIARVVTYHENELTEKDRELLTNIWGENNLPEYVPAIADRSKRDIANDKDVLKNLANLWGSLAVRYPWEYAQAFLLKSKGMWYLEDTSYLYDIYSYAKGYLQITYPSNQQEYIDVLVPGYERHQHLQLLQAVYRYFAGGEAVWRYIPVLAVFMQPAFYCWLLIAYVLGCIAVKKWNLLLPSIYLIGLAVTLLLGPCVLVRYMYPIMLAITVAVIGTLHR